MQKVAFFVWRAAYNCKIVEEGSEHQMERLRSNKGKAIRNAQECRDTANCAKR
jgi:hypothetical protein